MNALRFTRRRILGAVLATAGALTAGVIAKVSGFFSSGEPDADPGDAAAGSGRKPLRAVIVYYSATGNTAKVARAIHRGVRALMECDLVSLDEADPGKMAAYDLIGIGGPVWYFRETANLRLFAWKLPKMPGKLCFMFCAHGSEPIGFFASLAQALLKRSVEIIGWKDWFGSALQVLHMPKPYLTDGHPDAIDVASAEVFGREMADRARRIMGGEQGLIPAIPTGPGADELWINQRTGGVGRIPGVTEGGRPPGAGSPPPGAGGALPDAGRTAAVAGAAGAMTAMAGEGPPPGMPTPGPMKLPVFDMSQCVYPRCNACEEACPVGAIDFSVAARGSLASGSDLIVSKACVSCSICERVCAYDACSHEAIFPKPVRSFDMEKCTYPTCTLCVDKCPMKCIDLESDPPHVRNDCEGCDLCYCLCPKDAIAITNLEKAHLPLRMASPAHPFVQAIERYERAGKFRRLVPLEQVGFDNPVYMNRNAPRIVLNADPYEVAHYCDQACKS
ncbi:MAG: flavodoxin domain-containing protein [Gammaproteobacteria bacterium]|nr:flavodoxin domain-containing protein [Gammaproteobacteria bacterium]